MKKLLSALLAFAIVLTSLCIPAVAADDKTAAAPTTSTAQTLLPAYTAASSSAKTTYTDTYNDCILMTVTNTTKAEYTAYLNLLESEGFTSVLRGHKILGMSENANTANESRMANISSIYTKGNDYLVNTLWVPSTKEVKVTIEPLNGLDLSVFDSTNANTSGTVKPLLIQVGLDGYSTVTSEQYVAGETDTRTYTSGMCYIYRLSDGSFVVFDGGGGTSTGTDKDSINHAARIYETMKKYNQTANGGKGSETLVIAAWYITHPHTDHMGAFMAFTAKYFDNSAYKVALQRVICYLPNVETQTQVFANVTQSLSADKVSDYNDRLQTLDARGVHIYKAHVGQKYYFANMTIEILYTYDLLSPKLPDYLFVTDNGTATNAYPKTETVENRLEVSFTVEKNSADDKLYQNFETELQKGTKMNRTVSDGKVTYTCGSYTVTVDENSARDLWLRTYGETNHGRKRLTSADDSSLSADKIKYRAYNKSDFTNSFSITCQATVKVDSDTSYKAIWTGDVTCFGIETMNKMYGTAMKSDFVQVPHHGSTQMARDTSLANDWDKYYHETQVDLFYGDNTAKSNIPSSNHYYSKYTASGYGYVRAKYVFLPAALYGANAYMDEIPGDDTEVNDSRRTTWHPNNHLQEEVGSGNMYAARNFLTVLSLNANGTPTAKIDKAVVTDKIALPQATDGNYTLIYSAQDLSVLSATGKGKLAKDIYIQNPTSTVCAKGFKGELDGDGHTIYVSYTNGKTTNFAKTAGFLFSTLNDGANVHDLTLDGVNVTASAEAANIGLLAYNVDGTVVIDNVHIQNATVTDSSARNTNIGGMIPTTAAAANVTVKNSSFHGTIQAGTSTIASTVGGIFGRAGASEAGATKILIKNCEVGGSISHNKIAGGIVGNVNITADGSFEVNNCQNNAYVAALLAGGIVGNLADGTAVHTKLLNCVNTGDIECTSSNAADTTKSASEGNAGGAIGKATCASTATVTVTSFYNSGDILVKGGAATSSDEIKKNNARIGSVIGRVGASGLTPTLNITGAVNSGNVEADAVFEGIYIGHAGSAKNYTVTNAVNLNATVKSNGLVPGGQGNGNVTQPNVTDHSDKRFDTLTGARIRLSDTAADSGLRFDIVVDQALITALEDAGFTVKFGSLAAKADNVTGEFTKEAMDAAGKKYSDVSVAEDDAALRVLKNSIDATAYGYTAALINITSYNTIYACVGYLELTNAEGFSACIYTDYNATENARSVAFVANAALDDSTVTFTAEQTAILNTFAGN